ncbi:hypothetical protein BgAZ_109900 [Babesia gibsoni]|uniref:Uncharacterized protein n=1 Tax=Babesia gibsoni TaxID=33632 RepID=A0AAD8PGS4_BABGI|nr:hypothetical protein BgAZ_109900 [Babesia gibsoni]
MEGPNAVNHESGVRQIVAADLWDLRSFQQEVQRIIGKIYADNDPRETLKLAERYIRALDRVTGRHYSKRTEDVVNNTIHVVANDLPNDVISILKSSPWLKDDDSNRTFEEYFGMLGFLTTVKRYKYDEYSNILHVDYLILSYETFTMLYLTLLDALCHMGEWNRAIFEMMKLSVTLYFIRLDLIDAMRNGGDVKGENITISVFRQKIINGILIGRGIYLSETVESDVHHEIAGQALRYSMRELQLELWSRSVLIWLRSSSLCYVLYALDSLPLPFRKEMFLLCQLSPLPLYESQHWRVNESCGFNGKKGNISWVTPSSFAESARKGHKHSENSLDCTDLYNFLLTSTVVTRQCALEGLLMIAKIARDISHELYTSLCFTVYMSALIVCSSVYSGDDTYIEAMYEDIHDNCKDMRHHSMDRNCVVLHYALAYHMVNQRITCNFSSVDAVMYASEKVSKHIYVNNATELTSEKKYNRGHLHELDHFMMLEIYFASLSDTVVVEARAAPLRHLRESLRNNVHLEIFRSVPINNSRDTRCLCENAVKIENAVVNNDVVNIKVDFRPICKVLPLKKSLKGRNMACNSIPGTFNLREIATSVSLKDEQMAFTFEPNVAISLVAFCFTVDRPYRILHFKQSLEFMNYTDTLKKKHKAFIRKMMPWMPVLNTQETRKMINFQKFIKSGFQGRIKGTRYRPINGEYKPSNVLWANSSPLHYDHIPTNDTYYGKGYYNMTVFEKGYGRRKSDEDKKRSSLKSKVLGAFGRAKGVFSSAKGVITKGYGCLKQVYEDRNLLRSSTDLTGGYLHLHDDVTNYEYSGTHNHIKPICEHLAVNQGFNECDLCSKAEPFWHVERMSILVDWIAHFLFTGNLMPSGTMREVGRLTATSLQADCKNGFMNCIKRVIKGENYGKNEDSQILYSMKQVSSLDLQTNTPTTAMSDSRHILQLLGLLNELIETTIFVSLATFFHEKHYQDLLLRLSILEALQGRCNLSLAIIKQIKGNNSGYKTPLRCESFQSYNATRINTPEDDFTSHLAAKILAEILNENALAIETILSRNDKLDYCLGFSPQKENDHYGYLHDSFSNRDIQSCVDRFMAAKDLLIIGVSYLMHNQKQIDDDSISISDINANFLRLDHPMLHSITSIECQDADIQNQQSEDIYLDLKENEHNMQNVPTIAAEYILKSLSIDPNNFKAWVYLAHCAIRGHDMYFAYNCCKRSIECYDCSLCGWLTLAVVLSTRRISCAPLPVSKDIWQDYLVRRMASGETSESKLNSTLTVPSLPVPFDAVLPNGSGVKVCLDSHLRRAIGGDMEECLRTLLMSATLGSIYAYTAMLQLCARLSDECIYRFPWEYSEVICNIKIELKEINMVFIDLLNRYEKNMEAKKKDSSRDHKGEDRLKKMVSEALSNNMFISCIPLIKYLIGLFSPELVTVMPQTGEYVECSLSVDLITGVTYVEEIHGWISCLEILAQCGQAKIAQILSPILDSYIQRYKPPDPEFLNNSDQLHNVKQGGPNDDFIIAEPMCHFSGKPIVAADMTTESTFLKYYILCFLSKGDELEHLLLEIQQKCKEVYSRKMRFLECRVLASLRRYEECAILFDQLLRKGFICDPSTDYLLEYNAMKVYSNVLNELGMFDKAADVASFAEQCYFSTPVLKCDLCLIDPL